MGVNTFTPIPGWPLNNLSDSEDIGELLTFKKMLFYCLLSGLIYRHLSINLKKD